jgi:autotransporter-associated beta strand protein
MGADLALPADTIVTFGSTVAPGGPWSPRGGAAPMLDINGHNTQVGGLAIQSPIDTGYTGTPTITNTGPAAAALAVSNGADFNFAGTITNAVNSLSLVKLGSGMLTLAGANSYTGTTTVSSGALTIATAGALPSGNTIVNNASLNIEANSTAGAISGDGIISIASGVTLSATSFVQSGITMQLAASTAALNSRLNVSGALSLGGPLTLTLAGSFSPTLGQSFDLFDWGTRSGVFSSLQLPTLTGSLAWNTNQLYTAGVLSVIDGNFLPGDLNRDGHVTTADVASLISALTNLPGYESAHNSMTNPQLFEIADLNGDGQVTNADTQSLIALLANNATSAAAGALVPVPEPSAYCLMILGLLLLFANKLAAPGTSR